MNILKHSHLTENQNEAKKIKIKKSTDCDDRKSLRKINSVI